MRWPWQRQPSEPRGATIQCADESVLHCDLVRDPESYPDGLTHWFAVPPPDYNFTPGDRLHIDYVPGRTSVTLLVGHA